MKDRELIHKDVHTNIDEGDISENGELIQSIDLHEHLIHFSTESESSELLRHVWKTPFGKLMQAAPIPVVIMDSAYTVITSNEAWQKMFQDDGKKHVTKFDQLFTTPRGLKAVTHALEEVFSTLKPNSAETVVKSQVGKIWARFTFQPIRIHNERYVLVFLQNLTAEKRQATFRKEHINRLKAEIARRKKIEQALKHSHAELEELVKERTAELVESNEQLKQAMAECTASEKRLEHLAHFDSLTGLANRLLFQDRLQRAIIRADRTGRTVGVLLLDLDRFKDVNDSFGHLFGDKLLKAIVKRLEACVREGDTVGRYGGDEFVIILPDLEEQRTVTMIANRIIQAISEPTYIDGREVVLSTSIGIAYFPDDARDSERLLRHADTALYKAKSLGKHNYQFFSDQMNQELLEREELEKGLRSAIANDELKLFYQPIVTIETGEIVGVELVQRWNHPNRGWIPTDLLIQIAEDTGLIKTIGDWMLGKACEQLQYWHHGSARPIYLSYNASGVKFYRHDFENQLIHTIDNHGCDSYRLQIVFSEIAAMRDLQKTSEVFDRLSLRGLHIVIDGFGTGYTTLSHLKVLPINKLKIDKSFVRGIATDERDRAIVKAIITMAHSLGLRVVAEGIETHNQLGHLWALGCDEWQGNLFSKPLTQNMITDLLAHDKRATTLNFQWTEDLALHVETIDNQHKELCNRINELSKSIWNGIKRKELTEFVDFLHDYARLHFNEEQQLMEKHDYQEYSDHSREHDLLKSKVQSIKDALNSDEISQEHLLRTVTELQENFKNHLRTEDGPLGNFIRNIL